MKLGTAYDTLKDETKRRAYDDRIYPFITRNRPSSYNTQTPRSPSASTPQTESLSETEQIAAIQKSKRERSARWSVKRNVFDSSILALQKEIRQLEKEIKVFDTVVAAEAAEEAQQNSWGTWLFSSIYKKAEDSEEEKARKNRRRQEKRIEKDMKERRLELKRVALKKEEGRLTKAKEEIGAADMIDDEKIRGIQNRILATWERRRREMQEEERREKVRAQQQELRKERERAAEAAWRKQQAEERVTEQKRKEEERQEKIRVQQQELRKESQRAAAAARRKQQAEKRVTEQKRKEEDAKIWQRSTGQSSTPTCTSTCNHDGWWPKVQLRTACPKCHGIWNYLLECPGCKMKACPKCRGAIRRMIGTNRRATAKVETPSPMFFYDDYY